MFVGLALLGSMSVPLQNLITIPTPGIPDTPVDPIGPCGPCSPVIHTGVAHSSPNTIESSLEFFLIKVIQRNSPELIIGHWSLQLLPGLELCLLIDGTSLLEELFANL